MNTITKTLIVTLVLCPIGCGGPLADGDYLGPNLGPPDLGDQGVPQDAGPRRLAVDYKTTVKVFSLETQPPSLELELPQADIRYEPSWAPTGDRIALGYGDLRPIGISVFDLMTQQKLIELPSINPHWSSDGRYLLSVDQANQCFLIHDFMTGTSQCLGEPAGLSANEGSYLKARWDPSTDERFAFVADDSYSGGGNNLVIRHTNGPTRHRLSRTTLRFTWAPAEARLVYLAIEAEGPRRCSLRSLTLDTYTITDESPLITDAPCNLEQIKWSSTGDRIAFMLSSRSFPAAPALYVVDANTPIAWSSLTPVATLDPGVLQLEWAPGDTAITYSSLSPAMMGRSLRKISLLDGSTETLLDDIPALGIFSYEPQP